jgi:SpoIID/LytB domain protein
MSGFRRKRSTASLATLVGLIASLATLSPQQVHATPMPKSFGATVTIQGHGSGHGDGLSQWGALGYATQYGWDWQHILDHYYGGTTRDTVDVNQVVRVNLLALVDAPATTVVQSAGLLTTNADGGVGRFSSIVALETAPTSYRVYGRSDAPTCPTDAAQATLDNPASGWHLVAPAFVSTSLGARLSVTSFGIDPATPAVEALPGVCQPDGAVRLYRGAIEIVNGTAGENRTVNAVPVDQYLRGVVPQESIASWGDAGGGKGANALRAQAVAARTYALAEHRNSYAQTCDTTECQMYSGAARRSSVTAAVSLIEDPRTDAAVVATAGVVLRNGAGGLAYAQFGASSGGVTAGVNFPSVEDLGDAVAGNSAHAWTTTVSRSSIEAAFSDVGQLLSVDVTQRTGTGEWGGRAKTVRVRGTSGSKVVTGEAFRQALHLRSAWFNVPSGCDEGPRVAVAARPNVGFHAVSPVRLVDTRQGLGGSKLEASCVLNVHVAGVGAVATGAQAVAVNVTSVRTDAAGYLSAYPCDQGLPNASSVNARTEAPVANMAIVPVDSRGDICIFSQPGTDVIVDVLGWFDNSGAGFRSLGPLRVADSRQGRNLPVGPLAAASTAILDLSGVIPTGSSAAVLNVTATRSGAAGFLTVYPCDASVPNASNLNTVAGRDVANEVVVGVPVDGKVCIFTNQPTDIVVDLLGTFGNGSTFAVLAPARVMDTRGAQPLAPGETLTVPVSIATGSVAVNITATRSTGVGFVTAFPCDSPVPETSTLNVGPGRDIANQALVRVGSGSAICLVSTVKTDLIVDLQGRFG